MTQVQIVNLGLYLISQKVITAMNEDSVAASVATNVWTPCLEECLRGNNWSFAQVVEALVESSTYTPPDGYQYAYVYPSNAAIVWKVYNVYSPDKKKGDDFRELYDSVLGAKVLVTNCKDAKVEYTYKVTDTTIFDASFVTMLSYRLAAAFAMPLNADQDQAINMTKIFQNQMSEAQRISGYENNIGNGESPDTIINARMSGISGSGTSIGGLTFDDFNRDT